MVFIGDWNARIGGLNRGDEEQFRCSRLDATRTNRDPIVDIKGRKLVELMESSGFMVVNGRSGADMHGEYTFHGARGSSTVDLCWVNSKALHEVIHFEIGNELGVLSDHSECILHLGAIQRGPPRRTLAEAESTGLKVKWRPERAKEFRIASEKEIKWLPGIGSVDEVYSSFKIQVYTALAAVGMRVEPSPNLNAKSNKRDKPWYTKECRDMVRQVRRALKRWKSGKGEIRDFLESKKKYFSLVKSLRKQHFERISDTISNVNNARDWWQAIKQIRFREFKTSNICLTEWESFLEATYAASPLSWVAGRDPQMLFPS